MQIPILLFFIFNIILIYNPWLADGRAYIQASLHADEIPGLLVQHHLIKLLDAADARGEILKEILLVPYANPIGLSQIVMGYHMGRFSLDTGVNFNRDWIDVSDKVIASVKDKLSPDDAKHNIRTIRASLLEESSKISNQKIENVMKKELYRLACVADIVLDLHCDCGELYCVIRSYADFFHADFFLLFLFSYISSISIQ